MLALPPALVPGMVSKVQSDPQAKAFIDTPELLVELLHLQGTRGIMGQVAENLNVWYINACPKMNKSNYILKQLFNVT